MIKINNDQLYHIDDILWRQTSSGEPRGYIQPKSLSELWIHTGTICNLKCPFCFEGSSPTNKRIEPITLKDVKPYIEEALKLGTDQFSFTGGEPFVNKEIIDILDYALNFKPCLVLTNATTPIMNKISDLKSMLNKKHSLSFRVSIDFPDRELHDMNRGDGNFDLSLKAMGELHRMGFQVSVARLTRPEENKNAVNKAYLTILQQAGLPEDTNIVSFPNLGLPGCYMDVPQITERCMREYKTEQERNQFMCSYSKMIAKKGGKIRVYACTLVDDDKDYDLGEDLSKAMKFRIMLKHHRCYSCFSFGTSCSNINKPTITKSKNLEETVKMKVSQIDVKEYYGKVLKTNADLKTSACCSTESVPDYIKPILSEIEDEILQKFYGCGSPIPPALQGCTVLDLGCGTGRDVYILSKLVGEKGRVIGVDMTDEQLDVAIKYQDKMAKKFGFTKSNVEFKKGYIEDLDLLDIEDESIDVVVSNCVINLSFDKSKLLKEIFRVLKPGGELFFSDVFASRRIPQELKDDPVLIGECIAGAFYIEDFRRAMAQVGCPDPRILSTREIYITDAEIKRKIGMTRLFSQTVRAFKLNSLEDRCEDYGQHATYLGTIPEEELSFKLDEHHYFETGRTMLVCGNTASMLSETRYAKHFKVVGDRSTHFGLFNSISVVDQNSNNTGGGCC